MNAFAQFWNRTIGALLVWVLVGVIRVYQMTISPLLGPVCRYYPSCSHYGLQAVRVHGAAKGSALTVWRLLRCNPWATGGIDNVPVRGQWRTSDVIERSTIFQSQEVA